MDDIDKIRRVLNSRKMSRLADLLSHSEGELSESTTYGSYLFSRLSTYYIKSPPKQTDALNSLDEADRHRICDAVLAVYPPKDYSPEITNVEFQISFDGDFDECLDVSTDKLDEITNEFIQEKLKKNSVRIESGDYDGAVTNVRSLLESICKYILNEFGEKYEENKKLMDYYKAVSKILKMEPCLYRDAPAFQQILSGFVSIVNGLSSVRNQFGDAHGPNPQKKVRLDKRHAVLAVNSARVVADYLMSSFENKKGD